MRMRSRTAPKEVGRSDRVNKCGATHDELALPTPERSFVGSAGGGRPSASAEAKRTKRSFASLAGGAEVGGPCVLRSRSVPVSGRRPTESHGRGESRSTGAAASGREALESSKDIGLKSSMR